MNLCTRECPLLFHLLIQSVKAKHTIVSQISSNSLIPWSAFSFDWATRNGRKSSRFFFSLSHLECSIWSLKTCGLNVHFISCIWYMEFISESSHHASSWSYIIIMMLNRFMFRSLMNVTPQNDFAYQQVFVHMVFLSWGQEFLHVDDWRYWDPP